MSPLSTQILQNYIQRFDADLSALQRTSVTSTPHPGLTPTEAREILSRLFAFHHHVASLSNTSEEVSYLTRVGCRLSADLVDRLQGQCIDQFQLGEESLNTLQLQLRHKLQQQYQTNAILQELHHARRITHETAENTGLGVILS